MANACAKVLVIEHKQFRDRLSETLPTLPAQATESSFEFEYAERLSLGLARLDKGGIDVVLLDWARPPMEDKAEDEVEDLASLLKTQQRQALLPIIVLTADARPETARRMRQAGAHACLCKTGLNQQALWRALRAAVQQPQQPAPGYLSQREHSSWPGQTPRRAEINALPTVRSAQAGAGAGDLNGELQMRVMEMTKQQAAERKTAEETPQAGELGEEQLRARAALLDQVRDAIIQTDLADRVLLWNKGAERIYGWTEAEAKGRTLGELFYPAGSPKFEQARGKALEHGEWSGETKQQGKAGRELTVETRWTLVRDEKGEPQSFLVINTDISDRKRIEALLLRAQRMDSIGALASGIAHDLNNVLAPILMTLRPLQQKFSDQDSQRWLSLIQKSAERGKDLINKVLTFGKGTAGEQEPLQLSHLINDLARILQETLPRNIELTTSLADDDAFVIGDTTQLHQMLMNLCLNARDAMPEGGQLSIELAGLELTEQDVPTQAGATPGRYARVTVSDTGTGIPPELLDRIFDPFFTTKDHGKGTGLGLSIAMGIVRSHGGFIDVVSESRRGTQFKVYLPACAATPAAEEELEVEPLAAGSGEMVLVVDDEPGIREVVEATLEAAGYRVLTAEDGEVALRLYEQHKDEIRVVLTDLMMPKMDGVTAIRAMRGLNPQVRIIVTTGVRISGSFSEAAKLGFGRYLLKPYTAEDLLLALHQVLHKES
jgi:PAS domain S-box-containing protein